MKHIALLLISIFLFACESGNINKENYDKINQGMSKQEVESVLGKGVPVSSTFLNMHAYDLFIRSEILKWENDNTTITLTFSNDKLTAKKQTGL